MRQVENLKSTTTIRLERAATCPFGVFIKNIKIHFGCEIADFGESHNLQAVWDTAIARATGCVSPHEGYRSVTPFFTNECLTCRALFLEKKALPPSPRRVQVRGLARYTCCTKNPPFGSLHRRIAICWCVLRHGKHILDDVFLSNGAVVSH